MTGPLGHGDRRRRVVCQGITLWDFQPLVQRNPTMAWALLRTLAGMLREANDDAPIPPK